MQLVVTAILLVGCLTTFSDAGQKDNCDDLGRRVSENLKMMQSSAGKAKMILPQDCNFAKNSVILTRRYSKCLPQQSESGISRVYRNMRQVAKMICENVNKRVMPCFSPENMRQFTECTNRTLQYMSFARKAAEEHSKSTDSDEDSLTKEIAPEAADSNGSSDELTRSVPKKGPKTTDDDLGLDAESDKVTRRRKATRSRAKRSSDSPDQLSEYEHTCCMMHLNSDCFLTKVVHHCADNTQLRTVRLLQTMLNFVVRDVIDVVCGRIESLEQCKKYTDSLDGDDLGF